MEYSYKPEGVCCKNMKIQVEDGKVVSVQFIGGCSGNTQGIGKLVEGMDVKDVIKRLEGLRCGARSTSCPDQLAQALKSNEA